MITRILFGAGLGLAVAVQPVFDIALAVTTTIATQPPVIAFAAGVLAYPRIVRRLRRWAR